MLDVKVDVKMPTVAQAMRSLGVDERGRVQSFTTQRILLRMRRYMPWLSGTTATALTTQDGPASIVVDAPYARYLYVGVKMRDPEGGGPYPLHDEDGNPTGEFRYRRGAHPVPTGEPLNYTRTVNPYAGDHWDKTLMANEGDAIAAEVTEYARRLNGS